MTETFMCAHLSTALGKHIYAPPTVSEHMRVPSTIPLPSSMAPQALGCCHITSTPDSACRFRKRLKTAVPSL